MKKLLTVLAAVMAVAVSQFASAAVSVTISADKKTADFAFDASPLSRKLFIAYGNADAGGDTNAWENCEQVATAEPNATSLVGVTLPTGFGTDYFAMRAFLEKQGTAKDYVQTGLVALYDCRENVGWGTFDAASKTWRNLVANDDGTDLPFNPNSSPANKFETDNAHCARSIYRKKTSAAVTDGRSAHTLELNMKPNPADSISGEQWFALVGGLGRVCFRGNTSILEVAYPQKKSDSDEYDYVWRWYDGFPADGGYHTYTAQFGNPGSWPETWADGAKKSQSTSSYGWNAGTISDADYKFQLGLTNNKTDLELRSIRLYDKALTPDEVAHNRKVDVSRFEGGLPFNTVATDFVRTNWGLFITVY